MFGTLGESALNALVEACIDNIGMAIVRISVAILCGKWPRNGEGRGRGRRVEVCMVERSEN